MLFNLNRSVENEFCCSKNVHSVSLLNSEERHRIVLTRDRSLEQHGKRTSLLSILIRTGVFRYLRGCAHLTHAHTAPTEISTKYRAAAKHAQPRFVCISAFAIVYLSMVLSQVFVHPQTTNAKTCRAATSLFHPYPGSRLT
jgi:hypothetical protein